MRGSRPQHQKPHEQRLVQQEKSISDMREKSGVLYERLARIEANQNYQNDTLREIKDALKQK